MRADIIPQRLGAHVLREFELRQRREFLLRGEKETDAERELDVNAKRLDHDEEQHGFPYGIVEAAGSEVGQHHKQPARDAVVHEQARGELTFEDDAQRGVHDGAEREEEIRPVLFADRRLVNRR